MKKSSIVLGILFWIATFALVSEKSPDASNAVYFAWKGAALVVWLVCLIILTKRLNSNGK